MLALVTRITLFGLLPFVAVFFVAAAPGLAPAWDFANAAGLLAGVLFLLLFIYSGRPLARPYYDGKFFMALHRDLGYAALALLAVHVAVLLISEPLVLNYLLPSASWPMLAGVVATLLVLVIVPSSLQFVRQRLWRHHLRFRRWHYGLSALLLVLLAVHMLAVGFYTAAPWKGVLWTGLTLLALAWPLLPRARLEPGHGKRRRHTTILASRLSVAVLLLMLVLAGSFALLANTDLPL